VLSNGCHQPAWAPEGASDACFRTPGIWHPLRNLLQTGDPHQAVANYAVRSILLPTVSNMPRLTPADMEEYFRHFLQSRPSGVIDLRFVDIACNTAVDAGLTTFTFGATGQVVHARYTFTYRWEGGKWLITSHHSSAVPEAGPH
jgi:hypothetical protein